MLDFNHRSPAEKINSVIDNKLTALRRKQKPRNYLGASLIGDKCERKIQFIFTNTPPDPGRELTGKNLRIFAVGHILEDLAIQWFRQAGFDLRTRGDDGKQFGFESLNGLVRGHCDGIFYSGPVPSIIFPCLWECKTMNDKKWGEFIKKGVKESNPQYYGQVQFYQYHFALTTAPAILTGINKNDSELHHELIPYNPQEAQYLNNKAARIIAACNARELLPRMAAKPGFYECKSFCDYHERCWRV